MNGSLDYEIVEEAFPEIVKDENTRDAFARIFGISFSDKVTLERNGFGWVLTEFIDIIFKLFENADFRSKVGVLLRDEYPEGLPNLVREWLEVRLKGLASVPELGDDAVKVLKEIVRTERIKVDDLERSLNISRGRIIECLRLLELYKLVNKEYDNSYRPTEELQRYHDVLEGI